MNQQSRILQSRPKRARELASRPPRPQVIKAASDQFVEGRPAKNAALSSKYLGKGVSVMQLEPDILDDHHALGPVIYRNKGQNIRLNYETLRAAVHATAVNSLIHGPEFGVARQSNCFFRGFEIPTENVEEESIKALANALAEIESTTIQTDHQKSKDRLNPGDIVNISMQSSYEDESRKRIYLPIDVQLELLRPINRLTDGYGIIFVLAAGNSAIDLGAKNWDAGDGTVRSIASMTSTRRSIRVGYASNDTHLIGDLSNFGEGVDFYVRADAVDAACYHFHHSRLEGDLLDCITPGFGKSSAAAPIASGALACIQQAVKEKRGRDKPLDRDNLLQLIIDSADKSYNELPILNLEAALRLALQRY